MKLPYYHSYDDTVAFLVIHSLMGLAHIFLQIVRINIHITESIRTLTIQGF